MGKLGDTSRPAAMRAVVCFPIRTAARKSIAGGTPEPCNRLPAFINGLMLQSQFLAVETGASSKSAAPITFTPEKRLNRRLCTGCGGGRELFVPMQHRVCLIDQQRRRLLLNCPEEAGELIFDATIVRQQR